MAETSDHFLMPANLAEFNLMWDNRKPERLPGTLKYSLISLTLGRPLDRVMFVMVGETGSGKSTTINTFFADEHLCPTSDSTSETHQVTEYSKLVHVHEEQLKAYISFVDVPGTHDTDKTKEAPNRAAILEFTKNHPALQDRHMENISESTDIDEISIKGRVYPNMVLLTVSAADNRMMGAGSCLTETLRGLKETDLVDTSRPNLIVVVTHSACLGFVKEAFVLNMEATRRRIIDAVKNIIGIEKVIVVFIENMPGRFGFKKPEDSDFYALPNGELSHHNLFQAMKTLFENNKDYFGLLLTGWYFGSSPVEKQHKAKVISEFRMTDNQSDDDVQEAVETMNAQSEQPVCPVLEWSSMYLGHGYCPILERTRDYYIYSSANTLETKAVLNSRFLLPRFVKVTERRENYSDYCCAESKTSYEEKRRVEYGLEADMNFKVNSNINFRCEWEPREDHKTKSKTVSFLYEVRLAYLKMNNIKAEQLNPELREDLATLPNRYSIETSESFAKFFSKWGTHYVSEVWLGGSVQVFCKVKESEFNDERDNELKTKLELLFSSFGVSSAGKCSSSFLDGNSTVKVSGGKPPYITRLRDLTPEVLSEWNETLVNNPVELERSIKLKPYYDFVEGEANQRSLKEATEEYLKCEPESKRSTPGTTSRPSALDNMQNFSSTAQRNRMSEKAVIHAHKKSNEYISAILSAIGFVVAAGATILTFYFKYKNKKFR